MNDRNGPPGPFVTVPVSGRFVFPGWGAVRAFRLIGRQSIPALMSDPVEPALVESPLGVSG
jgi:hypothetical protein